MRSQVKEDLRHPQYWGLCGLKGCCNREPGMFLQKLMLIILSIHLGGLVYTGLVKGLVKGSGSAIFF